MAPKKKARKADEDDAEPEALDPEDIDADDDDDEPGEEPEEEPEEEAEEIKFADLAIPSLKELRAAMEWAFEKEDAPKEFLDKAAEHALMVQTANRRMNLTKIVDPKEIAAKHYLDCWRTTRLLPLLGRSVLDLGSGAGYPGIPLALAEDMARIVMVDSTQKKIAFIQECIDALGLTNATALWERGEEHLARNKYDVVILRAISSVRENVRLLRKVRHSLRDLVMMKGPSWSREVRAGEREAERLGFRLDTVWEHELPGELGQRVILVYRAPGSQGL